MAKSSYPTVLASASELYKSNWPVWLFWASNLKNWSLNKTDTCKNNKKYQEVHATEESEIIRTDFDTWNSSAARYWVLYYVLINLCSVLERGVKEFTSARLSCTQKLYLKCLYVINYDLFGKHSPVLSNIK